MIRNGLDWQKHVCVLLRLRYGGQFISVPDANKGDWGIEGYSTDGNIYQCYRPNEPVTSSDRNKKYKGKINEDLKKLKKNALDLTAVLGKTTITAWILVVEIHNDKEILKYLAKKEAEVQKWGLKFIGPTFKVQIWTDENDLYQECETLRKQQLKKLAIPGMIVGYGAVSDWADSHSAFVQVIDKKIAAGFPTKSDEEKRNLRDSFIRWYIEGQNLLAKLGTDFPECYQSAITVKNGKESKLADQLALTSKNGDYINDLMSELNSEFMHECSNLSASHTSELSRECIGDWIIRCPINFEEHV